MPDQTETASSPTEAFQGAQVRRAHEYMGFSGVGWIVCNPSKFSHGKFLVGSFKEKRAALIEFGYSRLEATLIAPFMWARCLDA